jgi:NAD(P)-dependent dehydrogenase (short-subunit alcohol dehydrogenase family)
MEQMLELTDEDAVTPELLDEMFDINFRGPYFTVQRLLPLMPSGASIILTTSVAADLGLELSSVYAASKAALSSLARTLSNELAPKGIRVNEVSPGPIETPIFAKMGLTPDQESGFKQTMAGLVPLKRMGERGDIIKTMHREMTEKGVARSAADCVIFDPAAARARARLAWMLK